MMLNCSINLVKKKKRKKKGNAPQNNGLAAPVSVIRCHLSLLNANLEVTPGDVCQVDGSFYRLSKHQCKQKAPVLVFGNIL